MKPVVAVLALCAASMIPSPSDAVQDRETAREKLFLMTTVQSQQGEIALGQLAAEHAEREEVRKFGERLVREYAEVNQRAIELANAEGVELFTRVPSEHKEKAEQLSRLSGQTFDRAYLEYVTHDRSRDVQELAQQAKQLRNRSVKQWAEETISVLAAHVRTARRITATLDREKLE